MPPPKHSREQLVVTAAFSWCMKDLLHKLGDIDTPHFLGQRHAKGTSSPRRSVEDILVVLPAGSGRPKTPTLRRAMLLSGVPHVCEICGLGAAWNDFPLALVIDHINGDWLDNRLANLRFLCPNCHAQTPTWCRKNRGC